MLEALVYLNFSKPETFGKNKFVTTIYGFFMKYQLTETN
jgi:hypothetical protein